VIADAGRRGGVWDLILTASLISSLCSSVNRLSGFASCPGPWDCVAAGADGGCCVCLGPSGPPKSVGAVLPSPRCLENDEALKGMAFVLTERSGIFAPAYERDAKGWPEAMAVDLCGYRNAGFQLVEMELSAGGCQLTHV
jgi:hypothetical protein